MSETNLPKTLDVIQAGVATFFGRNQANWNELPPVSCAIAGVPWDEGNAGRNGANMGPRAFRDASSWFFGYNALEGEDVWDLVPTVDAGDVPVVPPNAPRTMDNIAHFVRTVRNQGVLPLLIGGNHSLTIGATRGAASTVNRMGYLAIDTHLDTALDVNGERYSSGCPTIRAAELDNVGGANTVVFGVHGWLNPLDQVATAKEMGITWYGTDAIERMGLENALSEAIAIASDGADGLYVTFDFDSIDASAFPGTGTPEPGGFTAKEAFKIARMLGAAKPLAIDMVELAPIYDLSGISARLACGIALEMLLSYGQND